MAVVFLVSDSRRQSLSVITHTVNHTHTHTHTHLHFEWYDTRRSLDSHSGWTADAILYIVRSLHHQVFLDNLHALHYLACTPKLLHFVCLEAVCSEQLFHHTSWGWVGAVSTGSNQSTVDSTGFLKSAEPHFMSTNSLSGCLFCVLIGETTLFKEIIMVSLHSQSRVQYSTFKHWH